MINSRGHSLRSNLYLSAPKQTLEATYRIPLLKNPLNYYYDFAVGWEGEKKRTIPIREHLRCQRYVIGIMRVVGNILADFVQDTIVLHKRISLIKPYFFIQLLDLLALDYVVVPCHLGRCAKITFDLSKRIWLSESSFIKVQASSAWIRTYAENHRIVARAEIGYLHTKDIEKKFRLHCVSLLAAIVVYAVMAIKKLRLKIKNGKLVGGSRLLTGSLEYQYQVYPNWWAATFADSGLAANDYTAKELRYGAGVGVRWASPVGAIKFDIATPIRDKDNSKKYSILHWTWYRNLR